MEHNSYVTQINRDIRDYLQSNINEDANLNDVLELDFKHMLRYFLEWNGIIGYDRYIIALIEYCLGDIEDLEPHYDD